MTIQSFWTSNLTLNLRVFGYSKAGVTPLLVPCSDQTMLERIRKTEVGKYNLLRREP